MRRLALISGLLLTLTAGVWSSALAAVVSACCANETSASAALAPAADEHDCCRAKLGKSNAPHSEHSDSTGHSPEAATREHASSPESQTTRAHEGMDCEGAEDRERESKATEAFGERGRSCLECCAGRTGQMPVTATPGAPEQNKVKRAAAHISAAARDSFAPTASGVSHLAPSQHAPPAPRERRHKLISVFLI
jgi:hypothetical protein